MVQFAHSLLLQIQIIPLATRDILQHPLHASTVFQHSEPGPGDTRYKSDGFGTSVSDSQLLSMKDIDVEIKSYI